MLSERAILKAGNVFKSSMCYELSKLYGAQGNETSWEELLVPPPSSRSWYAATAIPFAANLAFLLHASEAGAHYVRLLVNELVVPMPGCSGHIDCPLDEFLVRPLHHL